MHGPRPVLAVLASLVVVGAVLPSGVAAAAAGSTWSTAIEVPGIAALHPSGDAGLPAMSCPTSGNCAAGGFYGAASGGIQAFVVNETGGVWGNAIEVPGIAALNTGGDAQITSMSCSSPGNCAAGGSYTGSFESSQAFVVDETGGVWGQAIEVPGTATLNQGGTGQVNSVSCAPGAAGNCSAAGHYSDSAGNFQAFVADEAGGVWGQAIEVPGTAALNTGALASADQMSCPAAGNCTIGGLYTDSGRDQQPFVARETSGVWGNAIELPGIAALNKGVFSGVRALSCTSPGNCSAAGLYSLDATANTESLFVATEKNGSWASAAEMPGIAALDTRGHTSVSSISCASVGNCAAGNCAAGGFYETTTNQTWPFVINEVHGAWGQAALVPGMATLDKGDANVNSVSCSSAGHCVAGGYYANFIGPFHEHWRPFVADETAGVWRRAIQVPGTLALNTGKFAAVQAVSCARGGTCALGGRYTVTSPPSTAQVFVDSQG
jgi:hypothetical protein